MQRKPPATTEDDDSIPQVWELREPTLACWRKHRDRLMHSEAPGHRPSVWWRYDKGMEPPSSDEESALSGTWANCKAPSFRGRRLVAYGLRGRSRHG